MCYADVGLMMSVNVVAERYSISAAKMIRSDLVTSTSTAIEPTVDVRCVECCDLKKRLIHESSGYATVVCVDVCMFDAVGDTRG